MDSSNFRLSEEKSYDRWVAWILRYKVDRTYPASFSNLALSKPWAFRTRTQVLPTFFPFIKSMRASELSTYLVDFYNMSSMIPEDSMKALRWLLRKNGRLHGLGAAEVMCFFIFSLCYIFEARQVDCGKIICFLVRWVLRNSFPPYLRYDDWLIWVHDGQQHPEVAYMIQWL